MYSILIAAALAAPAINTSHTLGLGAHAPETSVKGDFDGDGYGKAKDCDNTDPEVYPGAEEVTDGVDNDCDDIIDNSELTVTIINSSEADSLACYLVVDPTSGGAINSMYWVMEDYARLTPSKTTELVYEYDSDFDEYATVFTRCSVSGVGTWYYEYPLDGDEAETSDTVEWDGETFTSTNGEEYDPSYSY